jgi:excisionase family DNA binding protein
MSDQIVNAILASLDEPALDRLADLLAPRIARRLQTTGTHTDGWLDSTRAAAYLGITRNALHKLTAERRITFEQDGPGCKCWFRRSDLDAWRQGNAANTQPRSPMPRLRAAS